MSQVNIEQAGCSLAGCHGSEKTFFLLKTDSYRRRLSAEITSEISSQFSVNRVFWTQVSFWDLIFFYGRFRHGCWGKYISFLAACSYLTFPLGMFRRATLEVVEVTGNSGAAHLLKSRLRDRHRPSFRVHALLSPGWKYGGLLHCPDEEEYEFQINFLREKRECYIEMPRKG